MKTQELEVKYYVTDLKALEQRLQKLGAEPKHDRVLEVNLRFDTPAGDLSRAFKVLRLRQDTIARLTYKGPSRDEGGVRARQELEFAVSDFDQARAFLEALGYEVSLIYEKYRTTYGIQGIEAVLDELPYGSFIELEGPDPGAIQAVSQRLELDWEARVPASYTALFEAWSLKNGKPFRDLTFENFRGRAVAAEDLGVRPANAD